MKKNLFTIAIALLASLPIMAQQDSLLLISDADRIQTNVYKNVESRTKEIKENSFEEYRDVRLAALRNLISTSAFEANQLQSGNTVFNKESMDLVQGIMDHIVDRNKDEYDLDVNVYIAKSEVVNAFATDNGNIWVTLGLLSRVNNEAELAYVLCHELSHFIKKHSYQKVTTATKDIISGKFDVVGMHDYSKETELEADELGLELYANTDYNMSAISTMFDVLSRSMLPYSMTMDSIQYPFSTFTIDDDLIRVPPEYNQEDFESEDNKFSTHPSIGNRREAIKVLLEEVDSSSNTKDYIVMQQEGWDVLKRKAMYSMSNLFLLQNDFISGISLNAHLSQIYPDDSYIKYNLIQSWIQASYFTHVQKSKMERIREILEEREDEDEEKFDPTKYLYGEKYVIYKALNEMKPEVLFSNVLLSTLNLYLSDQENADYKHALHSAFFVIAKHFDEEKLTKRELIELLSMKKNKAQIEELKEKLESKTLRSFFESAVSDDEDTAEDPFRFSDIKDDKIVFINPRAYIFNQSSLFPYKVNQSYDASLKMHENLEEICKDYNIKSEVLSINKDLEDNPELADMAFITKQIFKSTDLNFDDDNTDDLYFNMYLPPSVSSKVREKYDCRYVGYVLEVDEYDGIDLVEFGLKAYYSLLLVNTLPTIVLNTFIANNDLKYIMIVYDLERNEYAYVGAKSVYGTNTNQTVKRIYLQTLIDDAY